MHRVTLVNPSQRPIIIIAQALLLTFSGLYAIAAKADALYLSEMPYDREKILISWRSLDPSMTEEEIGKQAEAYIKARSEAVESFGVAASESNQIGRYYYGKIMDYQIGPRSGSPTELSNHDIIVFQPLTWDGKPTSEDNLVLSAMLFTWVYHDIDTPKDFIWQFSNRHDLLGEEFGSEQHRNSIYSIFDQDGTMGLASGERFSYEEGVKEGLITRFIIEGVQAQVGETFLQRWIWTMKDPTERFMPDVAGMPNIPYTSFDLLLAMSQASSYSQIGTDIGTMAQQALSILCSMVLADPSLANPRVRDAADRARQIGLDCHQAVSSFLRKDSEFSDLDESETFYNHLLPVPPSHYREAALEFLASEDIFRLFSAFNGKDHGAQWTLTPDGLMPDKDESLGLDMIAEIALGDRAEDKGTNRQSLANRILRRWIGKDPSEDVATSESYELDRRTYRHSLLAWARRDQYSEDSLYSIADKTAWVYEQFCSLGWGHEDDMTPLALRALDTVWNMLGAEYGKETLSSYAPGDLVSNAAVIARILKSAGRDAHEKAILNSIEEKLIGRRDGIADSERIQYINNRYLAIVSDLISDASICAATGS